MTCVGGQVAKSWPTALAMYGTFEHRLTEKWFIALPAGPGGHLTRRRPDLLALPTRISARSGLRSLVARLCLMETTGLLGNDTIPPATESSFESGDSEFLRQLACTLRWREPVVERS